MERVQNQYVCFGFAVQKIGEQQHWSPEFTSFASQYAMDYIEMKEAKAELGRNGATFFFKFDCG